VSATARERRAHVLIAAERLPTRVGLRLALEREARCTEAADAESAVDVAVRERPDVCLLGLEPSGQPDEEEFMAAVRAGASGYLPQNLDPTRLPHVVRGALRGEAAVPRRFVARLLEELKTRERRRSVVLAGGGRVALTAREWEVVDLLLQSATTTEIARELGVAPVTVRRHLGSVERKLGVRSRAEVVELLSAG